MNVAASKALGGQSPAHRSMDKLGLPRAMVREEDERGREGGGVREREETRSRKEKRRRKQLARGKEREERREVGRGRIYFIFSPGGKLSWTPILLGAASSSSTAPAAPSTAFSCSGPPTAPLSSPRPSPPTTSLRQEQEGIACGANSSQAVPAPASPFSLLVLAGPLCGSLATVGRREGRRRRKAVSNREEEGEMGSRTSIGEGKGDGKWENGGWGEEGSERGKRRSDKEKSEPSEEGSCRELCR
eukprot:768532-Hanusia_phi.AAC.1